MNQFKNLIISTLSDIKDNFPDMTFGEILYALLRHENLSSKPDGVTTAWLLKISDEEFYNSAEKVIKTEKDGIY